MHRSEKKHTPTSVFLYLCLWVAIVEMFISEAFYILETPPVASVFLNPILLVVIAATPTYLWLIRPLTAKHRQLEITAYVDPLTQVYNRAYFDNFAQREIIKARRTKRSLSVLMCDIDHFKSVNDTFGHPEGDKVLAAVATLIAAQLREYDVVARYGGEEFIVALPEIEQGGAAHIAERIRAAIARATFPALRRQITISIGVATARKGQWLTYEELKKASDEALYQAKKEGRNRVVVWGADKGSGGEKQD